MWRGKTFWGLSSGEWGEQTGTGNCITCDGTMTGTRWCDNGDGTVTDMETGLVWLQNASWGGEKPWRVGASCTYPDSGCFDDAHQRAGLLSDSTNAELSDGSEVGDWRLPTKNELFGLATGTEPVRSSSMRAFTNVDSYPYYWTSTTYASNTSIASLVDMGNGYLAIDDKHWDNNVWPVRNPN